MKNLKSKIFLSLIILMVGNLSIFSQEKAAKDKVIMKRY